MKRTDQIIQQAERQCKQNGSRLTTKRKQVLAGLLDSDKALSAYELVEQCERQFGHAMPAMSVYRILDFLQQEQLVHELKLANKYVACSHISCDHAHEVSQFLICGNCQRVKEISVSKATMRSLEKSIKSAGYQLLSPQLEMSCLCESCANKIN